MWAIPGHLINRLSASSWLARARGVSSQSAARAEPCGGAQRSRLDIGTAHLGSATGWCERAQAE